MNQQLPESESNEGEDVVIEEQHSHNRYFMDDEVINHVCTSEQSSSKDSTKLTRKRTRDESEWIDRKSKRLKNSGEAYVASRSKKKFDKKTIGPICNCKKKVR